VHPDSLVFFIAVEKPLEGAWFEIFIAGCRVWEKSAASPSSDSII
jgi:hypothetical protein